LRRLGKALRRGSIWIFLAPPSLAAKAWRRDYWILLDFLGFSRKNLDLSMGYRDFAAKDFSYPFFPDVSATTGTCSLRMQKHTTPHAHNLVQILTFCNLLSRFALPTLSIRSQVLSGSELNLIVGFARKADKVTMGNKV
jgi:hypothetical protein